MKKLICALALCTLLCAVLCISVSANWSYDCINCCGAGGLHGENVKWYFDEGSGTLTLEGEGYMSRHGYYADGGWEPWDSVVSRIKHVVIGEGIVNVGIARFSCLENLETVTLSSTVTTIESHAFCNSPKLRQITMPGVTSIGESAFSGCGFTSVEIPDNVKSMGNRAFALCYSLESVVIGDGVEIIGDSSFVSCEKLASLSIGKNVKVIDELAFNGCALAALTIPEGVEEIGQGAFSCTDITELTLPKSLKVLGYGAFSNCTSLSRVTVLGETEIGNGAFGYCYSITRLDIIGAVKSIGEYAFYREPITEVHIDDLSDWLGMKIASLTSIPAFYYDARLYLNGEILTELVIPEGVTRINDYAFCYNDDLVSVSFPSTLESVGDYAFYECSISSLTVPDSVTEIGEYAFAYMGQLERVYLGSGVRYIDKGAFYNWNLSEVYIDDLAAFMSVTFVTADSNPIYCGARLYLGDAELTELVVPSEITKIGNNAFYYCPSITSVTLHENVKEIGERAFYSNRNLKSVTLTGKDLTVSGWAFYDCYSLESVTLSDGVQSIGNSAFYSCISLKEVNISSSVTSIEDYAFYNCGKLTELTVPSSVTSIGRDAFGYCPNLTLSVKVGTAGHIYAKDNYKKYKFYDYTEGDVDGDGILTNSDITLAVRAASGWDVGYGADTADLNFDGRISNRELVALIIKLAGV